MIKIVKEPEDFKNYPIEHCYFCNEKTRYWSGHGDEPVCPECAKIHNEKEIES